MASPSLISDRASHFTLDGPDWDFFERQKYFWNPLMDYWFRMEIEGWEKLPDPPVLLIGIHSGAPLVWDAWTVGVQWWRHFGRSRPIHGTAPGEGAAARQGGAFEDVPDRRPAPLGHLPRAATRDPVPDKDQDRFSGSDRDR